MCPISSVYASNKLLPFNSVHSYFLLINLFKYYVPGKVISSHLGYLTIYLFLIIILDLLWIEIKIILKFTELNIFLLCIRVFANGINFQLP